jgi:hypothetical protein
VRLNDRAHGGGGVERCDTQRREEGTLLDGGEIACGEQPHS